MTTATPRSGPKPAPPPGRPAPAQAAVIPRAETVAGNRFDAVPMTGAQSLVRSLEEIGCEVVFGIPGG
ncbi:MAG TPA: acetolactate synthase large subunit, partial [Mycobacterium sp.]|nr:acetolactate synthase large subunit [Mycobacterium sp.]